MSAYENAPQTLAENLINSYDTFLEVPERLPTPADLHAFLQQQGFEVAAPPTEEELEKVRLLRDTLREIWNATTLGEAIESLNALLAPLHTTPHITQAGEDTLCLTLHPTPSTPLPERLTLACGMDIVNLLQNYGHPRLRHCAAAPCRDVFIDTSRNRTRRFCSDRCANRYNVAAFRERRSANH